MWLNDGVFEWHLLRVSQTYNTADVIAKLPHQNNVCLPAQFFSLAVQPSHIK